MSDSVQPQGLKLTRLLCPPLSPGVRSNACPLSWWGYLTISSFATPSLFAFSLSQYQVIFQWVSSLHQVVKVLELQLQQQSFQLSWNSGLNDFIPVWLWWWLRVLSLSTWKQNPNKFGLLSFFPLRILIYMHIIFAFEAKKVLLWTTRELWPDLISICPNELSCSSHRNPFSLRNPLSLRTAQKYKNVFYNLGQNFLAVKNNSFIHFYSFVQVSTSDL